MILKKPYAFLIKNFKLVHLVLGILMVLISIFSYQIVDFIRTFIKNGYTITVTSNMVDTIINPVIYLLFLLVIGAFTLIMILLKSKDKSVKTYLFAIIYYVLLLIMVIIASGLINGLQVKLWATADARTYRDLANIIYYPQFIFVVIIFIRALGFNVKQFNFKNDLQEIEVTDSDSEEIELNVNFETYKAERFIRRFIRELKYYYLENKFVINIIGIILVIVLGYLFFTNYEKLTYRYKENKGFTVGSFKIKVLDSMITNVDQGGNKIYDGKAYVVIKIDITNNGLKDQTFAYDNLKLYYNGDYIYPSLDLGGYFIDYGNPYMGDVIYTKEHGVYVIPYMIDEKDINKSFKISIYTGKSSKKDVFEAKNAIIKLNPKKYFDVDVISESKVGESVSMSSSLIKNSTISIKNYTINTRFEYSYEDCYLDNCRTYRDLVVADNSYQNRQTLIIMDYELDLDNTASSYKNINGIGKFADAFMRFDYILGGITYDAHAKNVTPTRLKDKLIVQTDGKLLNAESVNLYVTIRNRSYKIVLK